MRATSRNKMSKIGDTDTLEEISANLNERWIWKDDSNTLELTSSNLGGLTSINLNKKATKGPSTAGLHNQDKRNDRSTCSVLHRGQRHHVANLQPGPLSTGTNWSNAKGSSMWPGIRSGNTAQENNVTLNDVKNVAKNNPIRKETLNSLLFKELYSSKQLDDFLWASLNYFDAFFERKALEEKPKPMAVEPSVAEKKALALVSNKEEEAKRSLAQCYGVLVLGLGLEEGHHMQCGRKRCSATQKDREQYETLYNFVSNVTWITFRRPNLEVIEKELGRLLRSDTFNPAARPKHIKEVYAKDRLKRGSARQPLTPAEYRRMQPKRPAIKSIVSQRSPVITALLPTSMEATPQYSNRKEALPLVNMYQQKSIGHKKTQFSCNRVGIIGESIAAFNPENLTPIGDEQEQSQAEMSIADDGSKDVIPSVLHGQEDADSTQEGTPLAHQQHQLDHLSVDEKFS